MPSMAAGFDMDTSISNSHPTPTLADPDFATTFAAPLPNPTVIQNASSHVIPDEHLAFPNKVDHLNPLTASLHVSSNGLAQSPFTESMEGFEAPAAYIPEITDFATPTPSFGGLSATALDAMNVELPLSAHASSASSPQLQPPSSSIHGAAAAYGPGVNSSLESALEPAVYPNSARSRSSTVTSSPGASIPFPMPVRVSPPLAVVESEEKQVHLMSNTIALLTRIAEHAQQTIQACKREQNGKATSIVENIKKQVTEVSDLLGEMNKMNISDNSSPSFSPFGSIGEFAASPSLSTAMEDLFSPAPDAGALLAHYDLESRKRCASQLEVERPVKSMKAEPQDEFLPVAPTQGFSTPPRILPLGAPIALSPSVSRPPSPTLFAFNPKRSSIPSAYQNFSSPMDVPTNATHPPPVLPLIPSMPRAAWSESAVPTIRHTTNVSLDSSGLPLQGSYSKYSRTTTAGAGVRARSGTIGSINNAFQYPQVQALKPFADVQASWAGAVSPPAAIAADLIREVSPKSKWSLDGSTPPISLPSSSPPGTWPMSSPDLHSTEEEYDDDTYDEDDNEESHHGSSNHSTPDYPSGSSYVGSDVPQEYRAEVDRIFFEYLNKVCSNLEATDSKGEAIHQTLMAKKMQRLDESKDFRPFKFRIQAFTFAFLEELARQGYPEEKIPMKKIRNYLWRQQYILRFNEDGKKAKSKGNHIWNVEAKKTGEGKWEFRPFHRKLAGTPSGVAYPGLRWTWTPRVWDPQAAWTIPVHYSSPNLPSWLSWQDDVLTGIPPPEAKDTEVTAVAKFMLDGVEGQLTHTVRIMVVAAASMDPSFGRPPQTGILPRSQSDSVLSSPQRTSSQSDAKIRVAAVLQEVALDVAHRVSEAQQASHFPLSVAPMPASAPPYRELVQQKLVVDQTVSAYDQVRSGPSSPHSQTLAVAAQQVVVEAAQVIAAAPPATPMTDLAAIASATVPQMGFIAQEAIAQAVSMAGPASNDLDVIVAAKDLLVHSRLQHSTAESQQLPMMRTQMPTTRPPPLHHLSALSVSDYV